MFPFFRRTAASLPPLKLHNTLSGKREEFVPLSREVKMYNCGPTVYGPQHIGNMRAAVFADSLRRTLEAWEYPVKQVINITDFGHLSSDADEGEDKMSTGLKNEDMDLTLANMRTLAEKYTQLYFNDIDALGVARQKITFPRASDYIPQQIQLIETLEQKGYAYKASEGVYFDVSRFPAYGKLGGINLEGLRAGARVETSADKRGPFDFLLWKSDAKIGWDSPWGKGFPGWHIECTAMIFTLLGKQIDIHTGGIEHIPVHHNNEIAQAEAATGRQFVRYWLHNDHITIEGKKISKSLGNTVYLHNIVDRGLSARALRYWFLTGHYRSPMNFTWDAIEGANTALMRLQRFFFEELHGADKRLGIERRKNERQEGGAFMKSFYAALSDDLNTPQALALIWDLIKDTSISPSEKRSSLLAADVVLGLGLSEKHQGMKLSVIEHSDLPEEVQKLVDEREAARKNKDFAQADLLRGQLEEKGFEVKDTPEGPQIKKK